MVAVYQEICRAPGKSGNYSNKNSCDELIRMHIVLQAVVARVLTSTVRQAFLPFSTSRWAVAVLLKGIRPCLTGSSGALVIVEHAMALLASRGMHAQSVISRPSTVWPSAQAGCVLRACMRMSKSAANV